MAESATVFDTASTLASVENARALDTHHLLGGELAYTLETYHMAAAGAAVSRAESLHTHHFETVSRSITLVAYHMQGEQAPIEASANTSVSRAFSIPVFEFGEDVGGTVDFTVE